MSEITLYVNCINGDKLPGNGDFLLMAAKRLGLDNIKNISECEGEPDYVLNCEYYEIFYKGKKWTGAWEVDTYLNRQQYRPELWDACDEIFVIAKNALLPRMSHFEPRTIFLPLAIDKGMHVHDPKIEKKYDFLIGGSLYTGQAGPYQKRVEAYNLLSQHFTYKDIGKDQSYGDWWKTLHEARVQFIRPGCTPVKDSILAQRFYEQMVIGPMLIYRCDDLKRLNFIEGEDYLAYDNDGEMLKNMRKLLGDPKFAKQIADNGRKKVLRDHTYEHRLKKILEHIPHD